MIMYSAPTGFEASAFQTDTDGTGTDVCEAMYRSVAT